MSVFIGETIQYREHAAKVIAIQTIFGETYLDVFIEPAGPICREGLLRQSNEHLRDATAGQRLTDVSKEAILTGFEEAY